MAKAHAQTVGIEIVLTLTTTEAAWLVEVLGNLKRTECGTAIYEAIDGAFDEVE